MTSGKRRLPRCRADDDTYEGSKQRLRLGGEEFTSNISTAHRNIWDDGSCLKTPLQSASTTNDIEQSIIRGVELMDLQTHASPLKLCLSNSLDADNFGDLKCNKYNSNPCINSKENKTMRKLKKVYFRNRYENLERKFFNPQSNTDISSNHQSSTNHFLYMCQTDPSKDKNWDHRGLDVDSLTHRENISSAGTPPDARSLASFEELGSQMTDDVFVKSSDSRRKRDVTDEEREDRIVKWLCTVRNMTESHGLFNVRLS